MHKSFLFALILMFSIILTASSVFASDNSHDTMVLAKMERIITSKDIGTFRKSNGDLVRYRALWTGKLPSGKEIEVRAMSSKHRVDGGGYAWRDVTSRTSGTSLFVELLVDGEKLMQLETHGNDEMRFDERLPSGELIEVFLDATAASSAMFVDIRLLKDFPKIEFLDDKE